MATLIRNPAAAALALVVAAAGPIAGSAVAAPLPAGAAASALERSAGPELEKAQYGYRGGWRGPAPRPYYAPRYYGGPRAYGGPVWAYRPWYRRPYYGTIIGGIALGTIVGVTAYGLAPRPPRPDLCWYWADEMQSQGYWDYC